MHIAASVKTDTPGELAVPRLFGPYPGKPGQRRTIGMSTIIERYARRRFPARIVVFRIDDHTHREGGERLPPQLVGHVVYRSAQLRDPRLHLLDTALGIHPPLAAFEHALLLLPQ